MSVVYAKVTKNRSFVFVPCNDLAVVLLVIDNHGLFALSDTQHHFGCKGKAERAINP